MVRERQFFAPGVFVRAASCFPESHRPRSDEFVWRTEFGQRGAVASAVTKKRGGRFGAVSGATNGECQGSHLKLEELLSV